MLKKSKEVVDENVKKINDFQTGKIKPITTGIEHLDYALLGGLKPSDVVSILGLPFHGKTYLLEEIEQHVLDNYAEEVVLVKCLWELEMFKVLTREMSKRANIPLRDVISQRPDKETVTHYKQTADKYRKDNIYIQEEPVTSGEFSKDIIGVIEAHQDKKLIVCIDNLENILVENNDQKGSMDRLMREINVLKKKHPYITFIILNQLNRNLEQNTDNPQKHFPKEGDIYGTGAVYKLSDVCVAVVAPYKMGLEKYGVFSKKRYEYIDDEFKVENGLKTNSFDAVGNIFYHYIKARGIEEEYDRRDLFVKKIFGVEREEPEKIKPNDDFDY